MISTDKNIFKEGSAVRTRMDEYSTLVDQLFVIVFTKKKDNCSLQKVSDRLWLYPTNSRSKLLAFYDAYKLAKKELNWAKGFQADMVTTQDPFETGVAGWLLARKFKRPIQFQIHTDFLNPYFKNESLTNKIRVLIARYLIPKATTLRVVSVRIKESLMNEYNNIEDRITVLPIFVDVNYLHNSPITTDLHKKYPQFKFIILMASRLTTEKNIPAALRIFKAVTSKYSKAGLIIVGEGKEKRTLQKMVNSLNLTNNVVFEPWQSDLVSYYKTANLFLLTSFYEGYGLTLMEAVACGCPVVSTDVGIAQTIIKDGETGFIVRNGDESLFTQRIIEIVENTSLREQIKINSKFFVEDVTGKDKSEHLKKYQESWVLTANSYDN